MSERKRITNLINTLDSLKDRYKRWAHDLRELGLAAEYEATLARFDSTLRALDKQAADLPTGYRYTGVFYIKKPYTVPDEFIKLQGSLFMREDLQTWAFEDVPGADKHRYVRAAYKEPHSRAPLIGKEDAVPVYASKA